MNNEAPRIREVWHARFNFEGGKGYKYRPVIVVGTRESGLLAMMVTNAANKLRLEHDHLIKDWREAPSIARADRIAGIPAGYLATTGRIGRLSQRDAAAHFSLLTSMTSES